MQEIEKIKAEVQKMPDKLTNRLRGLYEVGPNAEFGTRSFDFIPPISIEAAERIEELEEALHLIYTSDETVSEDPLSLIKNICSEVISAE